MLATIFGVLLGIVSLLFILVLVFGYVDDFKKGKAKESIGPMIVIFIFAGLLGWGSIALLTKDDAKEGGVKKEVVKKETDSENQEKIAKKETDEKASSEAKKEQVKQAYLKEIKQEVEQHKEVYDESWNKIWKPTMDAIANGSTDYYTAYNNLQVIKDYYQSGRNLTVEPVKGMDEADKKLLSTYESKMGEAFTFRVMAVELAQKGFNTGEMSPEDVNEMESYLQMADSSMVEAVAAITTIEVSLGIKN